MVLTMVLTTINPSEIVVINQLKAILRAPHCGFHMVDQCRSETDKAPCTPMAALHGSAALRVFFFESCLTGWTPPLHSPKNEANILQIILVGNGWKILKNLRKTIICQWRIGRIWKPIFWYWHAVVLFFKSIFGWFLERIKKQCLQ